MHIFFKTCGNRGAKLLPVVILATVAAAGAARRCGAQEPIPVPRPPLRIEIKRGSTAATAQIRQVVAINEKIAEIFQDQPVEFDPTQGIERVKLVCEETGKTLQVGVDQRSPVYIERSLHRLRQGEPGFIAVRVSDPASLAPGVYRGKLSTILRLPDQSMNQSIEAIWNIELAVHGRSLIGVEFEHAGSNQRLRVGTPASLVARVNTVGCDLGEGFLKLDWWSPGEPRQRALYLKLPAEKTIDPLSAFTEKGEQGGHPQWRDSPLWTEVRELSRAPAQAGAAANRLYAVHVFAPDCFLPGAMQAEVTWRQADTAAQTAELQAATPVTPVSSGVLTHPRLAFAGERVKFLVRTDQDLGPALKLLVASPDGKNTTVDLAKRRQQTGQQASLVEYAGSYVPAPEAIGAHQLAWPEGESQASLASNLGNPAGFQVCLGAAQSVSSLEVFAGAPPFWVMENLGWNVTRSDACRFWYAPQVLRDAALEPLGLYRGRPGDRLVAHDTQTEPLVVYSRGQAAPDNAAQSPEAATERGANQQAALMRWPLASSREKSPGLDVSVDLVRDDGPGHPRHNPETYHFVQRLMVHGHDTRGQPVARLAEIPLQVQVSTAGQYYRRYGLVAACAALLVILGVVLARKAAGPKRPRTGRHIVGDPLGQMDDNEDFFSDKSRRRPSSDQETEPQKTKKKKTKKKKTKQSQPEPQAMPNATSPNGDGSAGASAPAKEESSGRDIWD